MERLMVNTAEAAQYLSLSERTVWQMAKDGRLPTVRVGRALRFSVDSLREWISEQETT